MFRAWMCFLFIISNSSTGILKLMFFNESPSLLNARETAFMSAIHNQLSSIQDDMWCYSWYKTRIIYKSC